jgi:hypothetical protein
LSIIVSAVGNAAGSSSAQAVGVTKGAQKIWHVARGAVPVPLMTEGGAFSDGFSDGFDTGKVVPRKIWKVENTAPNLPPPATWKVSRGAVPVPLMTEGGAFSDGFSDGFDTGTVVPKKIWKVAA